VEEEKVSLKNREWEGRKGTHAGCRTASQPCGSSSERPLNV
jgi:hypothetical protein